MSSGTPPLEEGLGDSDVCVHTTSPVPLIGDRPPHDFLEHWTHLTAFLRLLADESGPTIPIKSVVIELADSIGNVEGFLNGGEEYEALKNKLENIFEMLAQHYGAEVSPGVSVIVERLCEDIDRELQHVKEMLNQDRLVRLKEESDDLEDVLRHYDRIIDMLKRVTLNANATMWKIMDKSGMVGK
ncbi:unnamed protein product [Rhizoctonia solani]|uniref:Uncharacterized protein n=1 Tax=Rhizoctonia solani TaxID=456999 RepID=A0A8H3B1V2_9AGAM|nr:unnamed protein product [Rhizoctonia solani]